MVDKLRILLMGEYSNVHWTLAEGLRTQGHEVTVVSDGDLWKDYPRDINLKRKSLGKLDTLKYIWDVKRTMRKLSGYDVVQLINPIFLDLKAERIWDYYEQLKRQNGKIFLGAFGVDHYWIKAGLDCKTFRYSDFNMGSEIRHTPDSDAMVNDWLEGPKAELNKYIASDCNGIVSGLYEYHMSYLPYYKEKLQFIPFPIKMPETHILRKENEQVVKFFIGIQKKRNAYKGTDIMLNALQRLKENYPDRCDIVKAENVPFKTYQNLMDSSDIMLDQLYSYTPAMNALLCMSKGIVVVGGAEPEQYELLGENELRPIINVLPNEENVYQELEKIMNHTNLLPKLKKESREYVEKYHEYRTVAKKYKEFWQKA